MTNEEMEVRAKKSLGQHFLTDLSIAKQIADALLTETQGTEGCGATGNGKSGSTGGDSPVPENGTGKTEVLEVGPGMGVLTQFLLQRPEIDLKMV